MRVSLRKFYRCIESKKEFKSISSISNGIILTKFDPKTGTPLGNDYYQVFVTEEELKTKYEEFKFHLSPDLKIINVLAKYLPDVVYQFRNYGMLEEKVRNFEEFIGHSPETCSAYRDMACKEGVSFDDYRIDNDDFYFSDAEEFFPFFSDGIVPVIKKMLIELSSKEDEEETEEV